MSVNMMNYITDKTYHEDIYNQPKSNIDRVDQDISNYIDLKTAYFTFLNKNNAKDKTKQQRNTIYNSAENGGDVITNYPLKFTEGIDAYILEIINDDTKEVLYKKTISMNTSINIKDRISVLTKKLINNNYILQKWALFNKVESIRKTGLETEALIEQKYITKDRHDLIHLDIATDMETVRQSHQRLKSELADFNIEHNILNKLVHEYDIYKQQKYSSYNIDLLKSDSGAKQIYDDIQSRVATRHILLDGSPVVDTRTPYDSPTITKMQQYQIIQQFINQSDVIQKGSLVLYDSSSDSPSDNPGQTPSVTSQESVLVYARVLSDIADDISPASEISIRILDMSEHSDPSAAIITQFKNIQKIVGLNRLLKSALDHSNDYTIPYDQYRNIIQSGGLTHLPEYHKHVDIHSSIGGNNYIKKTTVNYFYNKQVTPSILAPVDAKYSTKKVTDEREDVVLPLGINIIDEKDLYDEQGDVFMFYSKSAGAPSGLGAVETKITGAEYHVLNSFKDWRKKLSNFWINRDDTTGDIIPIIIDGIAFASVEHYFHYRKHWEVPVFGGEKKRQHSRHALKFTLSYKGTDGYGKSDGGAVKVAGRKLNSLRGDWFKNVSGVHTTSIGESMLGGGDSINLRDYILLKANYAKFTQNADLRDMLLATLHSKLIHPVGGSPRTCRRKYEVAFPQLFTRMLINKQRSLILYTPKADSIYLESVIKTIVEKIFTTEDHSKITMNNILNNLETNLGYSVTFKKKYIRDISLGLYTTSGQKAASNDMSRSSQLSKEDTSPLPPTSPPSPSGTSGASGEPDHPSPKSTPPPSGISGASGEPDHPSPKSTGTPSGTSGAPGKPDHPSPTSTGTPKSPIAGTGSPIQSGLLSLDEYSDSKVAMEESLAVSEKLAHEIEALDTAISKMGKTMYEVPPDGDCGYYAIVEMMAYNNIFPLNFTDGEEDGQYTNIRQPMNTSITKEARYSDVLYKAMLEARRDISTKYNSNISATITQSDELEAIKSSIVHDSSFDKYSEILHDKQLSNIRFSHHNKPIGGAWISTVELGLASALYNINIVVHNSYGTIDEYKAVEYQQLYPIAPTMNSGTSPATIHLGYYSNFHYIGIIDPKDAESMRSDTLEKMTYYTVLIVLPDGGTYNLILDIHRSDKSDEYSIIPLGIYDTERNIIEYFSYSTTPLHVDIVTEYSRMYSTTSPEYILTTPELFKPQYYYKDIATHKVYITAKISDKPIGHIKQKHQKDGTIYHKIEFVYD